jgi:hypothetical protein
MTTLTAGATGAPVAGTTAITTLAALTTLTTLATGDDLRVEDDAWKRAGDAAAAITTCVTRAAGSAIAAAGQGASTPNQAHATDACADDTIIVDGAWRIVHYFYGAEVAGGAYRPGIGDGDLVGKRTVAGIDRAADKSAYD